MTYDYNQACLKHIHVRNLDYQNVVYMLSHKTPPDCSVIRLLSVRYVL